MTILRTAALAGLLALSGGAASADIRVDGSFFYYGFKWTGDRGGFDAAWAPVNMGGTVSICGVVAFEGGKTSQKMSLQAVEALKVSLNGQPIVADLGFLRPVAHKGELLGARTKCRSTRIAFPKSASARWTIGANGKSFSN